MSFNKAIIVVKAWRAHIYMYIYIYIYIYICIITRIFICDIVSIIIFVITFPTRSLEPKMKGKKNSFIVFFSKHMKTRFNFLIIIIFEYMF